MSTTKPEVFFTPPELAVLATYLKKRDLLPAYAAKIDGRDVYAPDEWDEKTHGIAPVLDCRGEENDSALANAVARICLSGEQESLPQWGAWSSRGNLVLGRKIKHPVDLPPRILLPKRLFGIDWADSGPGYSWPETYYATEVPFFDVSIVTASYDCPDVCGYNDIAIGWFDKSDEAESAIGEIIKGQWRSRSQKYNLPGWAYLLRTGLINKSTAFKWADEVWSPKPAQENEEED